MILPHSLSARHLARQSSAVVNAELVMIWRLTLSMPSRAQKVAVDGVGEGVGEVVDVASVVGGVVVTGALIPQSRL